MKHLVNMVKWLIILIAVFGLSFFVYGMVKINEPFKTSGQDKLFVVPAGWTTRQIAESLEAEGLIDRAFFFELNVLLKKQGGKIQAGNYRLSPAMSIREITEILTAGKVSDNAVKFTVIEGWTMADIDLTLLKTGLIKKRGEFGVVSPEDFYQEFDFLGGQQRNYASLEGYLFPDTYLLAQNVAPEEIARKMLQNFDKKMTKDLRERIKSQGKIIREIVILASVVEREVGRNLRRGEKLTDQDLQTLQQERRLVASVFYNRLKIGKALESDATISYITGSKSNRATLEETKINSPYNTYKYRGLPPGPIANPSLDSILAAIYPAKTDYLYFVTAPDGTAYFARTLEEHMRNRERYLK